MLPESPRIVPPPNDRPPPESPPLLPPLKPGPPRPPERPLSKLGALRIPPPSEPPKSPRSRTSGGLMRIGSPERSDRPESPLRPEFTASPREEPSVMRRHPSVRSPARPESTDDGAERSTRPPPNRVQLPSEPPVRPPPSIPRGSPKLAPRLRPELSEASPLVPLNERCVRGVPKRRQFVSPDAAVERSGPDVRGPPSSARRQPR